MNPKRLFPCLLSIAVLLGASAPGAAQAPEVIYLPYISKGGAPQPQPSGRRVYVPPFSGDIQFAETAIFWFGQVGPDQNYADVRVGYNSQEFYVYLAAFDRRLWYDTTPSASDLIAWDSATLYLSLAGNQGSAPATSSYRFDGQLNNGGYRPEGQAAYRGNGSGWAPASISFATYAGWRGAVINDDTDDRGWAISFRVPFSSLGLSAPPAQGTIWGLGVTLHDRDSIGGPAQADQSWPEALSGSQPATWGQAVFGIPTYTPPPAAPGGTVTIRNKLNGITVPDAAVGGTIGNLCPGNSYYIWNEWGNDNFAGAEDFNIQNQSDVADWPCFAKYYVSFPLSSLPGGKVIQSATLVLHQRGNSGGGSWGDPPRSYIQVFAVSPNWSEATLTWNNAPLAEQNVSAAWVDPIEGCGSTIPWPCVPRSWDVTRAVAEAYAAGQPLSLALYTADEDYHSGKYFTSSDTGDWNAEGRPTLTVQWGDP
jgi:hypothetical protein